MKTLSKVIEKVQDNLAKTLRTRPLATFSILAFIFIILRLYFPVEPLLLLAFLIALAVIWLNIGRKIDNLITVLICVSMLLGIFTATNKINSIQNLTNMLDGQFVRVQGTVSSVPETNSYGTYFFFDCDKIYSHRGEYNKSVKLYVESDESFGLKYGDKLVFNAELADTKRVKVRLSKHYLSKGAPLTAEDIVILNKSKADFPKNIVASARNYIINIGNEFFTGDARELFKALTAGDKSRFSNNLTGNLNRSGLSHIACVSGLHVCILGMAIYNLFRKRNKYLSAVLSIAAVWVFALITGATPSTLRACMMFTSFIVAKITLMENDSFTALSFSAMVLAIINPYVIYDWGFILSYLSVLGIQIFSGYFKELFGFLPDYMADSISVTLSAQLMTIPVLTNMFGYLSTYSVPANIVISVVFVWVLYLCFSFIFVSFIPGVNWLIGIVCAFFLDIVASVANLFADLPMSILLVDGFDIAEYITYYALVLMFVFRKRLSVYFTGTVMLLCAAMLIITAYFPIHINHEYTVADDSVLFVRENKNVLLANDSLWEIKASFEENGGYIIDDVVIAGDAEGQESALIDLRKSIYTVHISEEYKNSSFAVIAQRMGCMVEYYPVGTDVDEYTYNLLD